ncbi:uncharacterized protein LOC121916148 [Sceloporus undulatus]|uniref:uncharacterized protein LOC121916148 n=1 Tax=Sceloporus undulatus TaxID=8520 RepID=UPI001C4C3911|nr:uncharacterized protein LOC121916148 [Sceloporus undulatus]
MAARRAAAAPPSSSSSQSPWSGHERLRFGERLQASLAGLVELELLRERQREAVQRALSGPRGEQQPQQQEEDQGKKLLCTTTAKLDWSKSEDLLEAPKTTQASFSSSENIEMDLGVLHAHTGDRLDKACFGLQIISEQLPLRKKAGINGGDTQEILEADSRPSSGFYDTSEMGSLTDSCASMHSEGPGGLCCSIGSFPHLPGLRESSFARPHSTDEAAVRLLDLQIQHLTLAANIRGSDSRRPVSTGDIEFLLGLGDLSLPLPKNPNHQLLQYKSDLVSQNTSEIYHYPSPLHAVALQSPLFTSSLSQSSSQEDFDEAPQEPAQTDSPKRVATCSQEQQKVLLDQYIAKLVLRYKCRSKASRTETGYLAGNPKSLSTSSVCSSVLGATQLFAPAPGWKIRRHISTCSHLRSPEGCEGSQESQILDSQGDFIPFLEIRSNITNLIKANEPSVMSLPDPLPWYPEPTFIPYPDRHPVSSEKGVLGWADGAQRNKVQVETPTRKGASLPQDTTDFDKLYKGKHASRQLVKTAERQEKTGERSWLSPRELLHRLSLRRRPSSRVGSMACASSEMNVNVATGLVCHSGPQTSKDKTIKSKWTSVMEISSKTPGWHRLKASIFPPSHMLTHHLAFSSDSPASFCFLDENHSEQPPQQQAVLTGIRSSPGKVETTTAIDMNGDWIFHPLGNRWSQASATLDSTDLPVHSFKLRRSRSFKELRKAVSRSFRGSRTTK